MINETNSPFNVLGVTLEWQLRSQQTDGQYCVLLATVPPQCTVPPHQHVEHEAFFMLEGTAEFASLIDGSLNWKPVSKGGMVNIPSDSVHGFRNVSETDVKCLITAHPGMETFFVEASAPIQREATAPTPEEIGRVLAVARRHGQRFLPATM